MKIMALTLDKGLESSHSEKKLSRGEGYYWITTVNSHSYWMSSAT